jgi:hypothetical protein
MIIISTQIKMTNFIKIGLVFLLLFSAGQSQAQGTQLGLTINPAWKVKMSRQKVTGLRTNQSGYGFTVGVPVKHWFNEFTALNTGLEFEFSAFDGFQNGLLVTSNRFNALHVPLLFNFHLSGNMYAMAGTGLVYNLSVKELNNVTIGANVTSVTNNVQPYLGAGVNRLLEKDWGKIEVGVLARYQLLDVWKNSYEPLDDFNTHLATLDFLFRYYF